MRFRTSVEFENLLKSRFQGIGLKGAGGRPSYSHPLRRSKVLKNPENLFDKTREPLLIALLIPAHPLLFSFWKYSFSAID